MLPEDLRLLCRDRELVTPELHPPNDYYGNASTLKRFVGISEDSPTYCIIEHAPFFPTLHWDVDLQSPLPVYLRVNRAACKALKAKTKKIVYPIGPMIAYADCHLDAAALASEKKRLGRNLLIFPPHSTHHIPVEFDRAWLMQHIRSNAITFDSITICLYWKDIASEPLYRAEGFECASAGHMFDPFFLNRLKTLLTLSDAVIAYSWVSAIGYATLMGKPTMALPARDERPIASPEIIARDSAGGPNDEANQRYKAKIFSLFSELRAVSANQREAIDYMWGLSDIKTRKELADILAVARDMHVARQTFGLPAFPNPLRQGLYYRRTGQPDKAALVLESACRMGYRSPDLLLETALAHADCGKMALAEERLLHLIHDYPQWCQTPKQIYLGTQQTLRTPEQLHALFAGPRTPDASSGSSSSSA